MGWRCHLSVCSHVGYIKLLCCYYCVTAIYTIHIKHNQGIKHILYLQTFLDMESQTALPFQSHRLWRRWGQNGRHRHRLHRLCLWCETRFQPPHLQGHWRRENKQKHLNVHWGAQPFCGVVAGYSLDKHTLVKVAKRHSLSLSQITDSVKDRFSTLECLHNTYKIKLQCIIALISTASLPIKILLLICIAETSDF